MTAANAQHTTSQPIPVGEIQATLLLAMMAEDTWAVAQWRPVTVTTEHIGATLQATLATLCAEAFGVTIDNIIVTGSDTSNIDEIKKIISFVQKRATIKFNIPVPEDARNQGLEKVSWFVWNGIQFLVMRGQPLPNMPVIYKIYAAPNRA